MEVGSPSPPLSENPYQTHHVQQVYVSKDVKDQCAAVEDHFRRSLGSLGNVSHSDSLDGLSSPASAASNWKQRKLPNSFFTNKSSANTSVTHSRDNSTDSSGHYSMSPPAAHGTSSLVQHTRVHSSPAVIHAAAQLSLPRSPQNFAAHQARHTPPALGPPSSSTFNSSTAISHHRSVSYDTEAGWAPSKIGPAAAAARLPPSGRNLR